AATLAFVLAYPVLLNDTGNDCPYCQLSPANLTDPFAHCGSRPDSIRWSNGSSSCSAARVGRGTLGYHGWFGLGSGLDLTRALATQRRSWLEGRHLIIGLKMMRKERGEWLRLLRWLRDSEGFEVNVTGLAIDMLDEIARRVEVHVSSWSEMRFQVFWRYSLRQPADGLWGGVYPNGHMDGMVKVKILDRKSTSPSRPFTMTAIRQTVIDFSEAFMEDGNTILIKKPGEPYVRVLSPFSLNSWLAILGSVFTAAVCMFLFSYLSPFSAWNMNLSEKISDEARTSTRSRSSSVSSLGFCGGSSRWVMMGLLTADMIALPHAEHPPAATVKNLEELAGQTVIRPVVKSGTTCRRFSRPQHRHTILEDLLRSMTDMALHYGDLPAWIWGQRHQTVRLHFDSTSCGTSARHHCDLLLLTTVFNVANLRLADAPSPAVYKADIK
uniref:Lig_chan-Glu_bd domain-containing protein n=1 Tax=Macrostomum lignano TaxID=282301 RepID=A0A1I8FGB1_9PLAT